MGHSDGFAWTVPGLAIASQAFLLQIALAPETSPLGRLLASLAGLAALLATAHFMAKQVHHFDLYEAIIERERERLGLPLLSLDPLRSSGKLPPNTSYVKRRWQTKHLWRHRLVARLKSVTVWFWTFLVLVGLDGFILVYGLLGLCGIDLSWLGESSR